MNQIQFKQADLGDAPVLKVGDLVLGFFKNEQFSGKITYVETGGTDTVVGIETEYPLTAVDVTKFYMKVRPARRGWSSWCFDKVNPSHQEVSGFALATIYGGFE
jgi:hypothetical protein